MASVVSGSKCVVYLCVISFTSVVIIIHRDNLSSSVYTVSRILHAKIQESILMYISDSKSEPQKQSQKMSRSCTVV